MKQKLQLIKGQAKSLFLWGLLVLLNLTLTDVFGQTVLPDNYDGTWFGNTSKSGWDFTGLTLADGGNLTPSTTGGSARFNSVGNNIVINFSVNPGDSPGALSYSINTSTLSSAFDGEFLVQEATSNGVWDTKKTFAADLTPKAGGYQFTHNMQPDTRRVRFIFSKASPAGRVISLDAVKLEKISGPEINVKQGATDFPTGSTYSFLTQNVKTTSNAVTFTIQNIGSTALNLTSSPFISISGTNASEFKVTQNNTVSPIAAGSSTTYTVSFAPTSFGNKSATVTILNDDSDESTYTVKLSGFADILDPVVTGINPASGQVGTPVTITGTNLINVTGVAFNGTTASYTIISDNQINATVHSSTPIGAGPVTVSVGSKNFSGPDFNVIAQARPTITGFTPDQGPIGQEVIITGTGYTNVNNVRFNGTNATYTVMSNTQIKATVQPGSTTGPISVHTLGGNIESASNFKVNLIPVISGFSPDSGPVGLAVTINGSNFSSVTSVKFNNTTASSFNVNQDGTQITTTVPAGATNGPITVTTTPGVSVSSSTAFTVVAVAPHISELQPASGLVDTEISIFGTNFTDVTDVYFNGVLASSEVLSDTEIIALVPEGATTGPIKVLATGNREGISPTSFTVIVPSPTITGFSPNIGIAGDLVTINGTNFTGATNVSFNGKAATGISIISDTQIKAAVPAGATTGQISVTANGTTVSSANAFTVNTPNTTYTWNGDVNTNWSNANNWTPARTTLTSADILIFDGSKTGNPTVNLDFNTSQTIGQIRFIETVNANLIVASNKNLNLDNDVAGPDLFIPVGSTVTISNSAANAKLNITITSGETGVVAGVLNLQGGAGTAAHTIITETVNSLTFQNGGVFKAGQNFSGNAFGTAFVNTVRFNSGATYINQAGGAPFGATAPASVVIFDAGSLYRHEGNTAPDLNDRTYSNFELNNPAFAQTVAGTGNLNLNNLTITAATNFDVNLSGTINIGGNISVVAGALNFNPASANNINMSGTGTKIISGAGTLSLGAAARLNVPVGIIVSLRKQIAGTGNVVVDGTIRTNVEAGFAGGANTALNSGVTHTLNAGSTIEYNGLGAQTISSIDYRNLIISSNRSGNAVTLAPGTIKVEEVFTNSATTVAYSTAGNTVEFNGAAQTIPVLPYNNLTASGTADKSIAGNIQVNGALNVNAKTISTGANKITLNSAATITESQTSYVLGTVEVTRNVTAGASQSFGGVGLTLAPESGSVSPGNTTVVRSTGGGHIELNEERQSIRRLYDITAAVSTGLNTAITLKYAPDELLSGQEESKLKMYKKNGETPWAEQTGAYTRSSVGRTVTLAGATGFSTWTLGEETTVLPVKLIEFTAIRRGQEVQLNWATAMELNNKGFEVQVSTDAKNFSVVGFVASMKSTSKEVQKYNYLDTKTKPADVLYYRLRQVDFDGTETYSAIKSVTYNNEHVAIEATAYPNPFDERFTVVVNADAQKLASITITDAMGRKVMEKTVTLIKGSNEVNFELGRQYPSGVYIVNITTNNFQQHLRIVKK